MEPRSFSPNRAPKMRERYQWFFGLRLASKKFHHSAIQTKIELHFGGFFHQMKVRQPIGRQDSMQTVIRTSRRLDSFLHQGLRTLNSYQIFKIKNKKLKTYSGWCTFKGLSNGTNLMQIQSGWTVLLILSSFILFTLSFIYFPTRLSIFSSQFSFFFYSAFVCLYM